jgi:hypothetical protein
MVQDDPAKRPTIDEVITWFNAIRRKLGFSKLCLRLRHEDVFGALLGFAHIFTTIRYTLRGLPAIPTRWNCSRLTLLDPYGAYALSEWCWTQSLLCSSPFFCNHMISLNLIGCNVLPYFKFYVWQVTPMFSQNHGPLQAVLGSKISSGLLGSSFEILLMAPGELEEIHGVACLIRLPRDSTPISWHLNKFSHWWLLAAKCDHWVSVDNIIILFHNRNRTSSDWVKVDLACWYSRKTHSDCL